MSDHPFFQATSFFRKCLSGLNATDKITGFFCLQAVRRNKGTQIEETPETICLDASRGLLDQSPVLAEVKIGVDGLELRCKIKRTDAAGCPFVVFLLAGGTVTHLIKRVFSAEVLQGGIPGPREFSRVLSGVPTLEGRLDEQGQACLSYPVPADAGSLSCQYVVVVFDT